MIRILFGNIPIGGFFMHPDEVSVMKKIEPTSRWSIGGKVNGVRADGFFAHWNDDEEVEVASACQYEVDGPHLRSNWRE